MLQKMFFLKKKEYGHMILFPLVLLYFEILLKVFAGFDVFRNIGYPVLFCLGLGLLCGAVTLLFKNKIGNAVTTFILLLFAILFAAECLIRYSFQFYISFYAVGTVSGDVTGDYMSTVIQAIQSNWWVILLFLLPVLLYGFWSRKYLVIEKVNWKMICLVLCGGLAFTGVGVLAANQGSLSSKYKKEYQFDTAVQYFGLVSSMELDLYYTVFGNAATDTFDSVDADALQDEIEEVKDNDASEEDGQDSDLTINEIVYGKNEMDLPLEELSAATSSDVVRSINEYVKSLSASSQNEYTGLFKGKNLILICAEAFSDSVISNELTPTLYRLAHNGFYFSDYYQPDWNGSTSTGEYSMLMGIAPLLDVRTMPATQHNNLYFTMGNQLHRAGYTGNAFHNGGYTYYSRNLTHENLGYDEYIAQGSGLEDLSGPWPSDSAMFEGTIPTYIDQQPFSVYYMTVSGHFPYEADDPKVSEHLEDVKRIVGDRYEDKTLYYLSYQMELEESLTILIDALEEKGIADDTVICLTADHYPYGLEKSSTYGNRQDYIQDLYGYAPETDWEEDKNAWILWSGCLETEYKDLVCEVSEPTYSLDILPTLSNLFGLEYDSRLLVGRDVFSDEQPLAIWVNRSWVSSLGKYDAVTDTFYPNEGMAVSERYISQMKKNVSNKLWFSGKIVDYDYYGLLFNEKQ